MSVESGGNKARMAIFSFITPLTSTLASQQKRSLTKTLQREKWFEDGDLLDSMEKGVLFPIIHHTEVCSNGNKPKRSLQDPLALGQDFNLQQGLYTEIKFSSPGVVKKKPSAREDTTSHEACIFMGFKKLDSYFSDVLEESWKDWTGARLVYMGLSDEFGLSRISFFRKVAPRDTDMFMYIVMIECDSVNTHNQVRLLDFVQRLRVERMMGYISVYRVEHLKPSTANVINGLLSESAVDSSDKVNI